MLRNSRGLTATVSDRVTGRLLLGSGRAFTIDAAQGISTKGEHINALSRGTAAASVRNSRGLTATVSDRVTGRLLLGSGRAFTIDPAQGISTKGEHINALSRGTAAASAFKMYTAESCATGRTHTSRREPSSALY